MEEESRVYKFRAWNEQEKRMLFGYPNLENNHFYEIQRSKYPGLGTDMRVLVVMQYTGQRDRNGVEIFQGDLLKRPNGLIYRVYWPDGDGSSYYVDRNYKDGFTIAQLEVVYDEMEVVGNVWQNWDIFTSDANWVPSSESEEDGVLRCEECGAEKTLYDEEATDMEGGPW